MRRFRGSRISLRSKVPEGGYVSCVNGLIHRDEGEVNNNFVKCLKR